MGDAVRYYHCMRNYIMGFSFRGHIALLAAAVVFLLALGAFASTVRGAAPRTVTWLLPHPPTVLFARAAQVFGKELSKKSGGTLGLEKTVLPADVFPETYIDTHDFTGFLDGETAWHPRMVSEYVGHLGGTYDSSVRVLDLPFLFDNYTQALAYLDGPGGQQLLSDLAKRIPDYEPLAFTMSGGFRLYVSKDAPILSPADLKGKTVVSGAGGPVIEATEKAFGATLVQDPRLEFTPDLSVLSKADIAETTYSRLDPLLKADPEFVKYVTETDHSMSLTIVLVTKKFYDSLSADQQQALRASAHDAAIAEKQDNIAYEDTMRAELRKNGTVITVLTPEQRAAFKQAVAPVRAQLDPQFDGLAQEIEDGLK